MKISAYVFVALTTLALLAASCTKKADEIGLDIQPPGDELLLSSTDTISVVAYSALEDSVRTDELSTSILGSFFDPVFGKTTASIFTEIRLTSVQLNFGAGAVIDSIVLSLAHLSIYGDSTSAQTFRVFEMTENINIDSAYYSNRMHSYDQANELGSISIAPPTDSTLVDTIKVAPRLRIPLNQILANKLLSGDSTDFSSNENFREFFNGLFITADPAVASGQGALITYNLLTDGTNLSVYYKNNDADSLKYTFLITSSSARYNHYEHYDYMDANPQFRQQVIEGDTALGNEILYLQALGGVRTHLKIPSLSTLGTMIESGNMPMISVNEAQIIFTNNETNGALAPPSRLVIGKVIDDAGLTTLLDDQREGESYFGGFYNKGNADYRFRLSRYVQNRILNPDAEDFGLLLIIPGASSVPQRVVLNGAAAESSGIKLVITYTLVE
jgi:hypothetical protein